MRKIATAACMLALLGVGEAHANGKTVRDFQQYCRTAIRIIENNEHWTPDGARCLNYLHGSRDVAAGVSGRSPICYRTERDTGDSLLYEFVSWAERHPEHAGKHVAYGVMATLMERHACR